MKDKKWLLGQLKYLQDAVGKPSFNEYTRGLNNAYDSVEKIIKERDGYEMEVEEEKYKVLIGEAFKERGLFLSKSPNSGEVSLGTNLDYFYHEGNSRETHLTKLEILSYDERYWAFAEEVTE